VDIDTGASFEVVTLTAVAGNVITANSSIRMLAQHPSDGSGSFGTGIIPPQPRRPTIQCSTDTVLKLYGDINRDGKVLYIEYTCAPGTSTAPGYLYRNQMSSPSRRNRAGSFHVFADQRSQQSRQHAVLYLPVQQANGLSSSRRSGHLRCKRPSRTRRPTISKRDKALLNISPRNVFYVWTLQHQPGSPESADSCERRNLVALVRRNGELI